jgi:hypothetical protein
VRRLVSFLALRGALDRAIATGILATEDLNLEHEQILPARIPAMINKLADLHHWSGKTLRGADI